MASRRFEIDASAGPATGSVLGRRGQLLIRVRLFDGLGVVDGASGLPGGDEDVFTDLRPYQAPELAARLIACAEQADGITEQAGWWQR